MFSMVRDEADRRKVDLKELLGVRIMPCGDENSLPEIQMNRMNNGRYEKDESKAAEGKSKTRKRQISSALRIAIQRVLEAEDEEGHGGDSEEVVHVPTDAVPVVDPPVDVVMSGGAVTGEEKRPGSAVAPEAARTSTQPPPGRQLRPRPPRGGNADSHMKTKSGHEQGVNSL